MITWYFMADRSKWHDIDDIGIVNFSGISDFEKIASKIMFWIPIIYNSFLHVIWVITGSMCKCIRK